MSDFLRKLVVNDFTSNPSLKVVTLIMATSPEAKKKGFHLIEHSLSLDDATRIGNMALNVAKEINAMPLSISILDKTGTLKYAVNQDGTGLMRNAISFGKGWTCLSMGFSSRDLSHNLRDRPSFLDSLSTASGGKMIFAPGGVLLRNGESESVVGAIGISGDTSYRDEYVAITAAQRCGFATSPSEPHPKYKQSRL